MLVLAACAANYKGPNLVKKYLAEVNAELPQGKQFVLEKIEVRDTSLVTVILFDATVMSAEELTKAKKTKDQDIQQVLIEYCERNRPYADLETQGYIFKIEMTVKGFSRTKTGVKALSQQACRAAGY